jgi:hypothetical protein
MREERANGQKSFAKIARRFDNQSFTPGRG